MKIQMTIEKAAMILITSKNGTAKWTKKQLAEAEKIEREHSR